MICVEKDRKEDILVVSEHGYGKRTDLDDYRITIAAARASRRFKLPKRPVS